MTAGADNLTNEEYEGTKALRQQDRQDANECMDANERVDAIECVDAIERVDVDEVLKTDGGRLIYSGAEGRIARRENVVVSDIFDGNALYERLVQYEREVRDSDAESIYAVHGDDAALAVTRFMNPTRVCRTTQFVFTDAARTSDFGNYDIRIAGEEHLAAIENEVHKGEEDFAERIGNHAIWGIFEDGKLAGVCGIHGAGSLGMLHIFTEYRRKGYARVLESYCIRHQLEHGRVPFCQVIEGNEASFSLQESLGGIKCKLPAIWISQLD